MPKYSPSDDGTVVGGNMVVFLRPSGSQTNAKGGSDKESAQAEAQLANAAAASMTAAAEDGVPMCEDCQQAKGELEAQLAEAQ
jgi:hypothetical protein